MNYGRSLITLGRPTCRALIPLVLGIITDGKGERPQIVLGVRRDGGIEPVDGGGGAQGVDGLEGCAPAGGRRVSAALEVVDDRASVSAEQLCGGPQPFAEPDRGDQEAVPALARCVDAVDSRPGRP